VAGILNVVFGILLLTWPASGILALVWLVGIFTLAGGLTLILLAFRVRQGREALMSYPQPSYRSLHSSCAGIWR
jgi:xanthosine utilization system XapX-like protein